MRLYILSGWSLLIRLKDGYPISFTLLFGCGYEVLELIPHSLLYFIVRAGNGVFAIATLAIFTRLLSPAEYGVYAICMTIVTAASAICYQWLNVIVSRFYPVYLDDPAQVLSVVIRGFWKSSAVAALFTLGALPFHDMFGMGPDLLGLLFLITVALGLHILALQVTNAQGAPIRYCLLSWAKASVALLTGFIFIYCGFSERGALLGFLAGLVFAVLAFAPYPWFRTKLDNEAMKLSTEMSRFGLPLTLNILPVLIVDMVDRFMIGKILGAANVAPYAVAYDLVQQLVGPVMNVLFLAAFPLIVKGFTDESDALSTRNRLHALGSGLVGLGLPVAVGIGVLAKDITEFIFDNHYRQDAAMIMPWLAASMLVAGFKAYFLDVVFQLRQATKFQVYIGALMAIVNVLLNLLMLPLYGVIAAAWTTLLTFMVGALASLIIGKSFFLLPSLGTVYLKSAIASSLMALFISILPSSITVVWLVIKILLGIVIYIVMAWKLDVAGFRRILKV